MVTIEAYFLKFNLYEYPSGHVIVLAEDFKQFTAVKERLEALGYKQVLKQEYYQRLHW